MKHLQFKNKTELGTAYYYCYGDERFEKWLKLKNIEYRYYNEGKNLFEEKDKEIERLNNIINELEKEINERITNIKKYGANFGITIPIEVSNEIDNKLDELNYCLRSLKKLKGDDKE